MTIVSPRRLRFKLIRRGGALGSIAVRLGVDADYLEALRAKVWLNGRGVVPRGDGGPDSDRPSTLFDVETYAKDLENLYRRMWSRHVKGLEPDHLPPESS